MHASFPIRDELEADRLLTFLASCPEARTDDAPAVADRPADATAPWDVRLMVDASRLLAVFHFTSAAAAQDAIDRCAVVMGAAA